MTTVVQTGSQPYNLTNSQRTPTFVPSANVTAGNAGYLLLNAFESTSMTIGTPTDNQGNTWTLVSDGTHPGRITANGQTQAAIYICQSFASTGALTITNHLTPGGGSGIAAFVGFAEVSGMLTSGQPDQVITGSTALSFTTTQAFASATSNPNDLLLAFGFSDSAASNTGHGVPAGWTQIAVNQDSTLGTNGIAIYQIVSATGTYSTTMGCSNGGNGYYMIMAALRSAGVTPTPTPTLTATATPSTTVTPTVTSGPTATSTATPTITPTISTTASVTPTPTVTPSRLVTVTVSEKLVNLANTIQPSLTGITACIYTAPPTTGSPNPYQVVQNISSDTGGNITFNISDAGLTLNQAIWLILFLDGSPARGSIRKIIPTYS